MKKVLVLLFAVAAFGFAANAQNNAIGVRVGGGQGYNAELSGQFGLGGGRLEVDLGWGHRDWGSDLSITGAYQWTGTIVGNFGWYAGVGAHVGFWSYDHPAGSDTDFALALVGQGGVEYKFDAVPIQLSLDIRPRLYLIPDNADFHWGDIAFGIRYCF